MIDSTTRIRVARPSRDLAAAERFYVAGLGLEVIWRTTERAPGEHDLLMVGPPGAAWHFELTHDPERPIEPTPTVDDLFVVYLGAPVDPALVDRLEAHGGTRVPAHNRSCGLSGSESCSAARPERSWALPHCLKGVGGAPRLPAYSTPGQRHASCAWSDPGRPAPSRPGHMGTAKGDEEAPNHLAGGAGPRTLAPHSASQIARLP
ncbi:VOC family protein [Streptomyces spongiae]|uniref:VOC family protein n=1 Tax=Streptomyces spongiae TaxID=565072 RepID=UPI00389AEB37